MLIGFKLSFGKHIEIDFTLTICYLNHIHIWETILQPFGYLIPHMNKKLVERRIDGAYSFHRIQKGACECSK